MFPAVAASATAVSAHEEEVEQHQGDADGEGDQTTCGSLGARRAGDVGSVLGSRRRRLVVGLVVDRRRWGVLAWVRDLGVRWLAVGILVHAADLGVPLLADGILFH